MTYGPPDRPAAKPTTVLTHSIAWLRNGCQNQHQVMDSHWQIFMRPCMNVMLF